MNALATWAALIGYLATFGSVIVFLRKLWLKIKAEADGVQCLLRCSIREIYYKHVDSEKPALREYERQDLDDLYDGYKALGGNHFVDDIYKTMRTWRVEN